MEVLAGWRKAPDAKNWVRAKTAEEFVPAPAADRVRERRRQTRRIERAERVRMGDVGAF